MIDVEVREVQERQPVALGQPARVRDLPPPARRRSAAADPRRHRAPASLESVVGHFYVHRIPLTILTAAPTTG